MEKYTNNGGGEVEKDWSKVPFWTSQRFLTAVITFWGFACMYLERINLSIAMVCMVRSGSRDTPGIELANNSMGNYSSSNSTGYATVTDSPSVTKVVVSGVSSLVSALTTTLAPNTDSACDAMGLSKSTDEDGEFTWDKPLQGLLLGSFFWGYLVLQVPGGMLSERYGPRRVVFFTMLPVALLNLVSPVSARASPYLFLVVRVLIGVGESVLYPAAQALFARWSPASERSRLVGISLSGGQFGNALIFPLGGLLCSAVNWESVFYVTGAIGFVWCILWFFLVHDSPAMSPRITDLEREYIHNHCTYRDGQKVQAKPWKAIFTSLPFWAIMVAHTCGNYGLYMMLTQIPTYMKEVLKFDLKSNGFFSMLPYLSMWVCISIAGVVADLLISRSVLSRLWTRRLMSAIGLFLPAVCIVLVTFMDCTQQVEAVILLCGCVGFCGFAFAGYLVNHGDIAPQFAGTLFGITNVAASVPGILAPYIVGAITTNKTREEWQIAFFVCAAIYVIGGIFYLIFSRTNMEKWAMTKPDKVDPDMPETHEMLKSESRA